MWENTGPVKTHILAFYLQNRCAKLLSISCRYPGEAYGRFQQHTAYNMREYGFSLTREHGKIRVSENLHILACFMQWQFLGIFALGIVLCINNRNH